MYIQEEENLKQAGICILCLCRSRNCSTSFCVGTWLLKDNFIIKYFKMWLQKFIRLYNDFFYGNILIPFPCFIHSQFTLSLFLLLFQLNFLDFSFTGVTTSSPLQNSRNFSLCRGSSRQLYHQVRWKFYVKQAGGKDPWSQKKMNDASLCALPCFTAAHRVNIHFLQGHCYKAHFRNILKCSSQTSIFQQVSLRSGEMSLGHDKQKTDFEEFLTYVSFMSLFVFFEVENKREGQQCDYYMRA